MWRTATRALLVGPPQEPPKAPQREMESEKQNPLYAITQCVGGLQFTPSVFNRIQWPRFLL